MEQYFCLILEVGSTDDSDRLVAYLSENGFEGFEELEGCLKAYRPDREWDASPLLEELKGMSISFRMETLEKTNWNRVWESNFEPVVVDDFVGIRADFHEPIPSVAHELVITPKMSFGTGHHATTRLMVQGMRDQIQSNDRVLDFGTGTGVLAILAKKMGAGSVVGIDNEDWSVENALENARVNRMDEIQFYCADHLVVSGPFDRILANINRNILLEHMPSLKTALAPNGSLLMSGILEEDLPVMDEALATVGMIRTKTTTDKGWACIQVSHNQ
jgi:ribosomal protein L11 methyltransferase